MYKETKFKVYDFNFLNCYFFFFFFSQDFLFSLMLETMNARILLKKKAQSDFSSLFIASQTGKILRPVLKKWLMSLALLM